MSIEKIAKWLIAKEEKEFYKGQKLIIDMGDGKEEVVVDKDYSAGLSDVHFITLNRKSGAPYTITKSKLKKVIV